MDHRAPRLVIIARIITLIIVSVLITNLKMNLIGSAGWAIEENVLLMKAITWAAVAWWASREREIPQFDAKMTSEQQMQSFEDMPTKVRSSSTSMDQYGLETVNSNSQTSSIINSILGQSAEPEQQNIQHALTNLGFVESEQQLVSPPPQQIVEAPVQQQNQQPLTSVIEHNQVAELQVERVDVSHVPLPHQNEDYIAPPLLPGLEADRVFVSEGIEQIPLPDEYQKIPAMPTLDDLFDEPESNDVEVVSKEEPELDDLIASLPELPEIEIPQAQVLAPAIMKSQTPTPELPDLDAIF